MSEGEGNSASNQTEGGGGEAPKQDDHISLKVVSQVIKNLNSKPLNFPKKKKK